MLKSFRAMFAIELALMTRNADMLVFGLVFPVGIMLLLGFISGPEAARLDFGGVVSIGVCAAGLMGLPLTMADYRHRKVLKRLRVTPVSPAVLLGAHALTQWIFSIVSGAAVFLVALIAFGVRIEGSALRFALTFLFVQACVFGIGFMVASLAPTMKAANAVASLLYFPMLLLSGATVPYEILPKGLRLVSDIFPLTKGIKLLKGAVMGEPLGGSAAPILVLSCLALASYAISLKAFRWD